MAVPRLRPDDLEDFVLGATLLGSGGGGDPALYAHLLLARLPPAGVALHPLDPFSDAVVVPVGMIGATSVLTEKLPHGGEIAQAVAAICRWSATTADAVMPVEAAGLNAALAVVTAVELGLPLVDADLMGRALPRFDQLTAAVAGEGAPSLLRSAALVEPGGQVLVQDNASAQELERTVRSYVAQAGGWAGAAFGPFVASELAGRVCEGTLARALDLGRASGSPEANRGPAARAAALGGRVLAAGRVLEVVRGVSGGFSHGSFAVADRSGAMVRIEAENEYLVAVVDGEPVATCPDLICVLDGRTAQPVAADRLRAGDDVQVLTLPGPAWWTALPGRLRAVGPRAFGYDIDAVLLPDRRDVVGLGGRR